jgi:Cys-rich four helix bundle protein (predicted Tat secretion target)
MDRRALMMSAATVALTGSAAAGNAETHHHSQSGSPLVDSALHCVKTGDLCQAHCFDLLEQGDKSLAACARSVRVLVSVCDTLGVLAAQNSPLLPRYASVASDACKSCEAECRKHADKHAACKDCADACAACAQECAKVGV